MVQLLESPFAGIGKGLGAGLSKGIEGSLEQKRALQLIESKEAAKQKQKQKLLESVFGIKSGQELQLGQRPKTVGEQLVPGQEAESAQKESPIQDLSDEQIAAATLVDPNLGRVLQQQKEFHQKETESARAETAKFRGDLAVKAKSARSSIKNKKQMFELLKRGKVDDPLVVAAVDLLPGAIGGKLLSPDTQVYKSAIFDEFGVLKTMFPGQIRVKEIELLEDKLATLEKSHQAKARILENGAKKLEADVIYAEAAREVEKKHPNARALEFEELTEELAKPKLDKLFQEIIDGYDKIYFEFAPAKSSYQDQYGNIYENVPKKELKELFEKAKEQGLDLTVKK